LKKTRKPGLLYLDASAGIAGDMTLASLIHAGADLDEVRESVALVAGRPIEIEALEHSSGSIHGLRIEVRVRDERHDRRAREILDAISDAELADGVATRASKVFSALARAEARVHGQDPDEVSFHEVGALDSIADIVGIAAALESLDVSRIVCSPLPMTNGIVHTRHGPMPVPAPATLELVRGLPVRGLDIEGEFVTPTGAAVCTALSGEFGPIPAMRIDSIGYGFGALEWPDGRPNCVRALLGHPDTPGDDSRMEFMVSANIDDMSPDSVSSLMDALFVAGCLDAWVTPITMKKGRPAWVVSAIANDSTRDLVASTFFDESTTIGVRIQPLERMKLPYDIETVETSLGEVRVKRARRHGVVVNCSIESDDLKRIADDRGMTVKRVREIVMREVPLEDDGRGGAG